MRVINSALPMSILLAVDDTSHSAAAVNLMTHITWPAETALHILAIVPDRLPLMERSNTEPSSEIGEALEILRWRNWAAATFATKQAAAQLSKYNNLDITTEVCEGPPAPALLKQASKLAADLIVIGAKEFCPTKKFQLSPTAHKIAHYANYSVLVARPSMQIRPMHTLIAIDGSTKAWRAVKFLCRLSLPQWARVTVVNVGEEANLRQVRSEADCCTANTIEHLHNCGVQGRIIKRFGDPADEILTIASEQNADLIVIGVQPQPNPGSFNWKGVAQSVVKYAPCSVLAVRREASEEEEEEEEAIKTLPEPRRLEQHPLPHPV